MWVLGTELGSSERSVQGFTCWAISQPSSMARWLRGWTCLLSELEIRVKWETVEQPLLVCAELSAQWEKWQGAPGWSVLLKGGMTAVALGVPLVIETGRFPGALCKSFHSQHWCCYRSLRQHVANLQQESWMGVSVTLLSLFGSCRAFLFPKIDAVQWLFIQHMLWNEALRTKGATPTLKILGCWWTG